jgi:hypothetical protein
LDIDDACLLPLIEQNVFGTCWASQQFICLNLNTVPRSVVPSALHRNPNLRAAGMVTFSTTAPAITKFDFYTTFPKHCRSAQSHNSYPRNPINCTIMNISMLKEPNPQ